MGIGALARGSGREGSPRSAASSVLSFHWLQPVSLYMATGGGRRVLCSVLSSVEPAAAAETTISGCPAARGVGGVVASGHRGALQRCGQQDGA